MYHSILRFNVSLIKMQMIIENILNNFRGVTLDRSLQLEPITLELFGKEFCR